MRDVSSQYSSLHHSAFKRTACRWEGCHCQRTGLALYSLDADPFNDEILQGVQIPIRIALGAGGGGRVVCVFIQPQLSLPQQAIRLSAVDEQLVQYNR